MRTDRVLKNCPGVKVLSRRSEEPYGGTVLGLRFHDGASIWDQGTLVGLTCPPMDTMDNDNGQLSIMDVMDIHGIKATSCTQVLSNKIDTKNWYMKASR